MGQMEIYLFIRQYWRFEVVSQPGRPHPKITRTTPRAMRMPVQIRLSGLRSVSDEGQGTRCKGREQRIWVKDRGIRDEGRFIRMDRDKIRVRVRNLCKACG